LNVKFFKVEELSTVKIGLTEESVHSPVAQISFECGTSAKTKKVVNGKGFILQCLGLPIIREPENDAKVKLQLFHTTTLRGAVLYATAFLDWKQILDKPLPMEWINFYGAPSSLSQTGVAMEMNQGMLKGSQYRGRCLIGAEVVSAEPDDAMKPTRTKIKKCALPLQFKYCVQCDFYAGSDVPSDLGKMHVEVVCGKFAVKSDSTKVVEGMLANYAPMPELMMTFPCPPQNVPDIFVYLTTEKNGRVSFLRFNFDEVRMLDYKVPPKWFPLRECQACDLIRPPNSPGSLLFSLRAGKAADRPARPYLVSRPLAGGNPYSTGMYPKTSVESTKINPDNEPEKDIEKIQRQTLQVSQVSKVGNLTLTVLGGQNLPISKKNRELSLFVKAFVGFSPEQASKPAKKVANTLEHKFEPAEVFTFRSVCIDQPLVIELWKDKITRKQKVSQVSIDLLQQNIQAIAILQDQDPDCEAEVGQDFERDTWIPVSDKFSESVLNIKLKFEYVNGASAEIAMKKIAAKDQANRSNKISASGEKLLFVHSPELGRPSTRAFQLRAHFFVGRNFAGGSDGKCNLICYIRCWGKTLTLPILPRRTADPRWFRTVFCNLNLPVPLELAPDVRVSFFDVVSVGRPKPVCRFQISCKEARAFNARSVGGDPTKVPEPKWFACEDMDENEVDTQVYASFQLLTSNQVKNCAEYASMEFSNLPKDEKGKNAPGSKVILSNLKIDEYQQRPEFKDKVLKIATLNIPKLNAPLLFSPLIRYTLSHVDQDTALIPGSNQPTAYSPYYGAITELKMKMSDNIAFAPTLEVYVKDKVMGKSKLIGFAMVNLQKMMEWQRNQIYEPVKEEGEKAAEVDDNSEDAYFLKQTIKLLEANTNRQDDDDEKNTDAKEAKFGKGEEKPPNENTALLDKKVKGQKTMDDSDDDDEKEEGKVDRTPPHLEGRYSVSAPLEQVLKLNQENCPFFEIKLKKPSNGLGMLNGRGDAGSINALVHIMDKAGSSEIIDRVMKIQNKDMIVRLHIIDARSLPATDTLSGSCDPYVQVKLGKQKQGDRNLVVRENQSPDFYQTFQFRTKFPGAGELKIIVKEFSAGLGGKGDMQIGCTEIDLDDRFYSRHWKSLAKKPMESRTLFRGDKPAGKINIILDILDVKQAQLDPGLQLKRPDYKHFELRCVVWNIEDLKFNGQVKTKSPLVRLDLQRGPYKIDSKSMETKGETDTHSRSSDGKASFNWRVKLHLLCPAPEKRVPKLTIGIFEKNVLTNSDSLIVHTINLSDIIYRATKDPSDRVFYESKAFEEVENKTTFDLKSTPTHGNYADQVITAKLCMSIELVEKKLADEQYPNGDKRKDPNAFPHLPEREGRIGLLGAGLGALNDMKNAAAEAMWNSMKKVIMMWAAGACLALIVAVCGFNYFYCGRCIW